jgi:NAD+ kinase
MQTVALIPKRSKPEAVALAEKVAAWLIERGRAVISETGMLVPGTAEVSAEELAKKADLIVVLGGDGTLLHAARLCERREVPILAVNLGTLGFMTEVQRDRLYPSLERLLAGKATVDRRLKLAVVVRRGGQVLVDSEVLNDVVINKNALARIADIEAFVGGQRLTTFKADGVIVATPTGSSAYSLAAGGPLIHPSVKALLVMPICPHTLTQRPIVLADTEEIELVLESDDEMFVTLDGQSGRALQRGDRVIVKRASTATLLVRDEGTSYFGILRDKLKWGER